MNSEVLLTHNEIRYDSTIGCDVHSDNIVCNSLQRRLDGKWAQNMEVFPTTHVGLQNCTDWCQQFSPSVVLMESTGPYWMSPFDAFEAKGLPIKIVNPAHVKRMDGRKTDKQDAKWLSQIAVNGAFTPSYVPPIEFRHLRALERNLLKQKGMSQSLKNRESKILSIAGFRFGIFSKQFGACAMVAKEAILSGKTPEETAQIVLQQRGASKLKATKEELTEAFRGNLTDYLRFTIESNRRLASLLDEEVKKGEEYLISEVKKLDLQAFNNLRTIPGIDDLTAAVILVEIGGSDGFLTAFRRADRFAAWAGLAPGNNESNNKRTGNKGRKGNKYLRKSLIEAAHSAAGTKNTTLRSKFCSLKIRRGSKKAVVAVAHKMAKIIFSLLSNKTYYRDALVNYQELSAKKNMSRWLRAALACRDYEITVKNLKTGEVHDSKSYQELQKIEHAAALKKAVQQPNM